MSQVGTVSIHRRETRASGDRNQYQCQYLNRRRVTYSLGLERTLEGRTTSSLTPGSYSVLTLTLIKHNQQRHNQQPTTTRPLLAPASTVLASCARS
jgi:hypothetical protein